MKKLLILLLISNVVSAQQPNESTRFRYDDMECVQFHGGTHSGIAGVTCDWSSSISANLVSRLESICQDRLGQSCSHEQLEAMITLGISGYIMVQECQANGKACQLTTELEKE